MGHEKPIPVDLKPQGSNMKAAGKRLPVGGASGDTFNHYAWMDSATEEQRDAIFRYIRVLPFTHCHRLV